METRKVEVEPGVFVEVEKYGNRNIWRGKSPFANEKTPGFLFDANAGTWHDFATAKSGKGVLS